MLRICALLLMLSVFPAKGQDTLTVSAAVSLTNALEVIAKAYAAAGGSPVRFNFAGSNVLARQLVNGAPADVFISADAAQMDVAANAGAIDPASRIDLLSNRLAVITRPVAAGGTPVRSVEVLLRPTIKRIALGDPSAVPAGVYAQEYLRAIGQWAQIEPKVVPVANVRAALTVVENGSADAAIVYETDAALSTAAITAFVVSGPSAPRIVYPAAIASRSTQSDAARRFLSFLRGSSAAAIFRRFGFTPLASTP